MEFVDKLNNKRLPLNKIAQRKEKIDGEYRQSIHTWILNSKGEFLMQKRAPNKQPFPNMWSQTGGGVNAGESSLEAALRECKEELGITITNEDIELMLSFKRKYDFVDVYLIKKDIDISDITLQVEEVSETNWFTIEDIKELSKNNELTPSVNLYFDILIDLINEYY